MKAVTSRLLIALHLWVLATASIFTPGNAVAGGAPAPGVRVPLTALPSGPTSTQVGMIGGRPIFAPQVVAGTFNPYQVGTNSNGSVTGTITQTNNAGILQWNSFDIGANARVNIVQPSSTAVLLNKVSGGAFNNQTLIEGILNGNGQVYIYNPNGIVFGKTSQVNVNTLVATTLKIDDNRFLAGLLAPNISPVFIADPDAKLPDGVTLVGTPGAVTVEGDSLNQARLAAANGGKILLIAPSIINNGQLSALDGQVVLAAGHSIYLASPSDIRMRGLVVEVNNGAITSSHGSPAIQAGGSTATNDVLGKINVGTGNATMVGLAVNQMGVVSATTSVSVNGSIYLRARDGATRGSISAPPVPSHGGALVLGANSTTEILPTLDDTTTSSGSAFNASLIDLSGNSVHLLNNAKIVAPAGEVNVSASATADSNGVTPHAGSSITLDAGAVIDVSGTTTTQLAMESNVIKVDLRGTEFADDPLLRNSALRGKTVSVDARKGNLLFANIQGWLDLVQHNVGERTAIGGKVRLQADDAIVLNQGSRIDVSGGKVSYLPGHVATTQLTSFGRVYDISSATPDRIYDGVLAATPGPRNFESGYDQGYSAGTLHVTAPTLSLNGTLRGTATPGPKQREVASSSRPLGGELIVGNLADLNSEFIYKNPVVIGSGNSGLVLDPLALTQGGFTRLSIYTQDDITVNRALQLAPGGTLTLVSVGAVDLAAGISAPGGKVSASSLSSALTVDQGVTVDVSGRWTNDRALSGAERDAQGNPTNPIVTQGGNINLSALTMTLASASHLGASGGAWLNASGKLAGGNGGSISVNSSTDPGATATQILTLGDGATFSAYSVKNGGKLTLSGYDILLGTTSTDPRDLGLFSDFFQQGGFSAYDIRAARNVTVAGGASIAPRMDNWVSNRITRTAASGSMRGIFDIATLPLAGALGSRGASSLSLSALSRTVDGLGRLDVQAGASIVADPGATVNLSAGRQLTVDGSITAHGGNINLALTPPIDSSLPYRAERSIWLGSNSVLDASGSSARLWQDGSGVTNGDLLDGGTIHIGRLDSATWSAAPGYVIVNSGATLDVSGTSAVMTLKTGSRGGVSTTTIASAGGTVDVRTREGFLFAGTLKGAGGNAGALGGSLTVDLDRENIVGPADYPTVDRNLVVGSSLPVVSQFSAGADQAITGLDGQGFILTSTINAAGFDWVTLKSQNTVSFNLAGGNLALTPRAGLIIDTPGIVALTPGANSAVNLNAPYVQLGNADWRYQSAPVAASGNAALRVNAGTIDLIGQSALIGFDTAALTASGDVRLVGQIAYDLASIPATAPPVTRALGSFSIAGGMDLTADQVYPTTMSEFTLQALGAGSHVGFSSTGDVTVVPLSAAGTLTVRANTIVQNGVVRAPFGSITLAATDGLSYGAHSLTSVAGSTTVPLGLVQNGRDWLYDFGNGHTVNLSHSTATNFRALPQKSVVSQAVSVNVSAGAVIDLSGGGDLLAYEFTPGPGGSRDVLAKTTGSATANVFAVLPVYSSAIAPRDFQYGQDGGLRTGDSVYLSGIPGLAAGYYTLLPAHYALLPGAYSISVIPATQGMAAADSYQKLDGSWVVAGQRSYLGGGAAGRSSGFLLTPYSVVQQESQYASYAASKFFSALGQTLPQDAGRVSFDVMQSLKLNGQIKLDAAGSGARGSADISAPEIVVVADAGQALPAGSDANAVELSVAELAAIGADSLLLGGVRDSQSDGDHVTVGAQSIVVANDASHSLSGTEVILAANESIKVLVGSVIEAQVKPTRTARDLLIEGSGAGADGALLRVSGGSQVAVVRNAAAGAKGTLTIESGASLGAAKSMNLDATKSLNNDGSLRLGSNAALGLGANRISLGSTVPAVVDGLRFDSAALSVLNSLANLALTSYTTFDIYGATGLGGASTQSLTLRGAGIQSYAGNGDAVVLTANTVRFDGGGTFALATPAPASAAGSLTVAARDIEIGNNSFAVKGYSAVNLTAQREVRAVGNAGAIVSDSDMTVAAGRITSVSGADASIQSNGALTLARVASPQTPLTTGALGGKLTFTGNSITSDATIVAKSGQVRLKAAQGVHVNGGEINASGYAETFGSTVAYAPGGSIMLDGGSGNVVVANGALLDVSATGADAGSISIKAANGSNGHAVLAGTLKGGAVAGIDRSLPTQGRLVMDVDVLDRALGFGALNAKLDGAGFTESRNFRLRAADVVLAAGESMTAHQVVVAADNGNISIDGTIDARGGKGGNIALYAAEASDGLNSGNVIIQGGARLLASASTAATSAAGSTGDGGSIVIGTSLADGSQPNATSGNASISVNAGAALDVSGSGWGQGGTVLLRAPRVSTNDDVAIATLDASTIHGSRSTAIEAYKVYTASKISASTGSGTNLQVANTTGAPAGKMYTEANSFVTNANAILGRLTSDSSIALLPGMEVQSAGDLTVSVNETLASAQKQNRGWNLDAWRFNGQPGVLTLRAGGNLIINGSISDGFAKSATAAMPDWALDTSGASSWSYRLIGGADTSAANPLMTTSGAGDVRISFARTTGSTTDLPVALVRTGTGFINISAGQNVVLDTLDFTSHTLLGGDFSSVDFTTDKLLGASIYTSGRPIALASGYTAPSNKNNAAYGSTTSTGAGFTSDGGAITILAARDVVGSVTAQMINNWLFRQGRSNVIDSSGQHVFDKLGSKVQNTAWWSRFDYFDQGIATFGGGDISVIAETGNVIDVSASIATNAFYYYRLDPGTTPLATAFVEQGGGDLLVRAGGDIRGGSFYVQKGSAVLSAAGSVTAGDQVIEDLSIPGNSSNGGTLISVGTILAAGDTHFHVTAGRDLEIEGVFNPTMTAQSVNNVSGNIDPLTSSPSSLPDKFGNYSTYGSNSSVSLTSVSGNLVLSENANAIHAAGGSEILNLGDTFQYFYLMQPGTLHADALSGDLRFDHGFSLAPSATGQLDLVAKGSVYAQFQRNAAGVPEGITQPIVMIDRDPSTMPTALVPVSVDQSVLNAVASQGLDGVSAADGLSFHTAAGLHANDLNPVRIIALNGDIDFSGDGYFPATVVLPKRAEISAGRDIIDLGFTIQHLASTDVTTVSAGRDIGNSTKVGGQNVVGQVVSGPGRVDFTAGRNFDLGNSAGVVTRGNLDNPYLPAQGASIDLVAGATPDYAGFAKQFLAVADLSMSSQTALVTYMLQLDPQLSADISPTAAWSAFNALPLTQRRPFLDTLFFDAVARASGAIGGGTLNLAKFDAVIASLFPTSAISGGDVNVFGSQLKTDRGGSISIYAPGGSVFAGLVTLPAYLKNKAASDLGIFTIGGGALQSLVKTDFLVNQGRVFTLGGGDITLVSQYGNIDAGKGAKTAQSAPPPILTTDAKGNTVVDISGSIAGSGIATLRTGPNVPASNVYPIAPRGIFDAGDAGVRSTGSVNIVAATVLNANNIAASGNVSGTHAADTGGLGGAVAAPANTAVTKTDSFANSANLNANAVGTLTVELLGYGGGDSQENVTLDSQNVSSDESEDERKKKKSNSQ